MPKTDSVPATTPPLKGADVRGLARLGVDATLGVTDLVEAMHHTIASFTGIRGAEPSGRTRGITGFVYGAVRGTTRVVGKGLDLALGALTTSATADAASAPREAVVAALNGIWGDHLVETGNPLAIEMSLRSEGRALDLSPRGLAGASLQPSGRIVVLVHGLCMNDLQWRRNGHDHGQALAHDLGVTPVYLHYNTGRHISENGHDFSALLERLISSWPVPVTELLIVGHSMGGLVTRSACHIAQASGAAWLGKLSRMVFLGTPHHGAPLERGGRLVDAALGLSPYVAPFARLGNARSVGITDLRYGNVQDADWQGRHRHTQRHDDRLHTPFPQRVEVYLVAATMGPKADGLRSKLIGDGLVPLASALGEHRDPSRTLTTPESHRQVVTRCHHMDLLDRPDVYHALRDWLSAPARRKRAA